MEQAVPTLLSRDFGVTRRWYERLGFEVLAEYGEYLIVTRGTIQIHFALDDDLDPGTNALMCYVYVRDVDAIYAEWAKHLPQSAPPRDEAWHVREFNVLDPDHNLLRIGTIRPHRPGVE